MLVVEGGANVDAKDENGDTPLHWAKRFCEPYVLRMLVVEGGANVNITNKDGETPLHYAALVPQIAHFLLDKGARPDIRNNEGVTAIDLTACPHEPNFGGILPSIWATEAEPRMALLCRMLRESGALIVLAMKVLATSASRRRLFESSVSQRTRSKRRRLDAVHGSG